MKAAIITKGAGLDDDPDRTVIDSSRIQNVDRLRTDLTEGITYRPKSLSESSFRNNAGNP